MLGDRELVLSAGRFELLRFWKNAIMAESANDQTEIGALHEIAWVMWLTGAEVKAAKRMTLGERREAVLDFALEHEDELSGIENGIKDRLMSIRAATVEAETPGKEPVHAS